MLKKKIFLCMIGTAMLPALALGAINLKKVSIVDGSQIELLFDGKVEPGQVKTEFVRDNIQLSLSNTSVYPAKVSMVSGSDLTKVFAYQYAPSLVRARFSVKGEASDYANRLQVKITGKTVTVRIAPLKADKVTSAASSTLRTVATAAAEKTEDSSIAARDAEQRVEQKALLERVAASDREKAAERAAEKASSKGIGSGKKEPLGTTKSLPSPFRSIGVMLFVLGVFGLFVMFLKRMKNGAAGKSAKAARGGLGGFLNKLSGAGAAKQMIEVVATHHLAPKRSIVVVRVQDRMLVLGMTNDSVNLITEFKANEEGEAEENIGIGDFAASLKKFENEGSSAQTAVKLSPKANLGDIAAAALGLGKPRPVSAPKASMAANAYQATSQGPSSAGTAAKGPVFSPAIAAALNEPSIKPSIRAQIKDRVQGMKQL